MGIDNNQKCARNKLIAIGTITSIAAIVYIFVSSYYYRDLVIHANLLALIGSVSLIVGAIRQEHRFLYPWFLTSSVQLYIILFLSVIELKEAYQLESFLEVIGMNIGIGVGLFFMNHVYTQFKVMRKNAEVGGFVSIPTAVDTVD